MNALTIGKARSAEAQALTKKLMKPRLTPCLSAKGSLYCLRVFITAVMSTSLKVVSIAAVCCASTRRDAIRWRMGLIFSCVASREPPDAVAPPALPPIVPATPPLVPPAGPRCTNASTSCSRTRPPGPVPCTLWRSTWFSLASFFASGVARTSPFVSAPAAPFEAAAAPLDEPGEGAPAPSLLESSVAVFSLTAVPPESPPLSLFSAFASAPPPPPEGFSALSSIEPTTAPTSTVSPSLAPCESTPAAGAGISIVILSVSSSMTVSSRSTHSPSPLVHAAITPSLTDSPTVGMTMSVAMLASCARSSGRSRGNRPPGSVLR